jgi:hypothetical protein
MEFPGRIYLRAEDDIHSAEHQTKLNKWILEFQRLSRESFVFPERGIRSFGYMFFVIGLILMIIQVYNLCHSLWYFFKLSFLIHFRLPCLLFKMFTFQVFSVREFGLDC